MSVTNAKLTSRKLNNKTGRSMPASRSARTSERAQLSHAFKVNSPSYLWYFSPWVKRFVNTFVLEGRKATAGRIVRETFFALKRQGMVHPYLTLFEVFEMLRLPVRAFPFSHGRRTRMIIQRLPWWRQYTTVTQWFRAATVSRIAKSTSASRRLLQEFVSLLESPAKSRVWQRRVVAYQAISEGRQLSRFVWSPKVQERLENKVFQLPPHNDPLINLRNDMAYTRKRLKAALDSKHTRHMETLIDNLDQKHLDAIAAQGMVIRRKRN